MALKLLVILKSIYEFYVLNIKIMIEIKLESLELNQFRHFVSGVSRRIRNRLNSYHFIINFLQKLKFWIKIH